MGNKIHSIINRNLVSPEYKEQLDNLADRLTVQRHLVEVALPRLIDPIPKNLSLREPPELGWDLLDGRGVE